MTTTTTLKQFHAAIKVAAELDPHMSLTRLDTFLTFANDNSIQSMDDLRTTLASDGLSNSAAYRNISYWLDQSWLRRDGTRPEGEKFIKDYPDPQDHRRKLITMTAKGASFIRRIEEKLDDGVSTEKR